MNLVLLFFCTILITVGVIAILIFTSKLKVNIVKININNCSANKKTDSLRKEIEMYLDICILEN